MGKYEKRGVSSKKEDVLEALKNKIDNGILRVLSAK